MGKNTVRSIFLSVIMTALLVCGIASKAEAQLGPSIPVILCNPDASVCWTSPFHAIIDSGSITIVPSGQQHVILDSGTLTGITNPIHTIIDSGTTVVTQGTGSNLHMVIDSGTITSITNHVTVDAGTNTSTANLALDATLTARFSVLGQNTMSASAPVVIASDQSTIPTKLQRGATVTSSFVSSGSACPAGGAAYSSVIDMTGYSYLYVEVSGGASGGNFFGYTLATNPPTDTNLVNWGTTAGGAITTFIGGGTSTYYVTGLSNYFRVKCITLSSGTATFNMTPTNGPLPFTVVPNTVNVQGPVTAIANAFADGALTTMGLKADAAATQTDTTAVSIMSVLKEISKMVQAPAALPSNQSTNEAQVGGVAVSAQAKGTQATNFFPTMNITDTGRNTTTFFTVLPIITTSSEALLSLTGFKSDAAVGATTTPAVVTTGKKYRITNIAITYVAVATAGSCRVSLRKKVGGTVSVTDPVAWQQFVGGPAAAAGDTEEMNYPVDIEVNAGDGIGISQIGLSAVQVAAAVGYCGVMITGYEY